MFGLLDAFEYEGDVDGNDGLPNILDAIIPAEEVAYDAFAVGGRGERYSFVN